MGDGLIAAWSSAVFPAGRLERLCRVTKGAPPSTWRFPECTDETLIEGLIDAALKGASVDEMKAMAGSASYRDGFRRALVASRVSDIHRLVKHAREQYGRLTRDVETLTRERDALGAVLAVE